MGQDDEPVDHSDFLNLSRRLEYLHSEQKSFRSETSNSMHALDKRIAHLEYEDERKEERLGQGAAAMTRLGDQIERVNGKIDLPWYKVAGMVVPALLLLGSWIWFAARMPSGGEFDAVKSQVWEIRSNQLRLEDKVDALLKRP